MDVATTKGTYGVGENVTFKVSLYNSENLPIDTQVNVIFESPNKKDNLELIVPTNEFLEISLGDKASFGSWKITAKYGTLEANSLFFVEENELLRISMQGDIITIRNMGNIRFAKNIDILIGNMGYQKPIDLDVDGETSFRLLAPDGVYDVKITGGKTTFTKSGVKLTGLTGNAIGTLDEKIAESKNLVTGINPANETGVEKTQSNLFIYIFISAVLGAAILLAIERHYKKKI